MKRKTMCPYREQDNFVNFPLFSASAMRTWIASKGGRDYKIEKK